MGGFKKWATSDVLTASDLNGYCSFQSVMVFASTAARDSAIASGDRIAGMVVYINSGDSNEGLYVWNGASWTKGPGWNAPWGLRSSKTDATDRTRTTTMGELTTSLRTTATFIANRWLRFTLSANLAEGSNGGGFVAEIYNVTDAVTVGRIGQVYSTLGAGYQIANSIVAQSASGAIYTVRMQGITHSVNVYGSSVETTRFVVEDIGPSGAPV